MMNVEAGEGSGIFVFSSPSFFNWGSWIGSVLSLQISVFLRSFLSESSFCEFSHDIFLSCCFLWQVDSLHIPVPFQSALTSWHFKKKMGVFVMTTLTVLPAKCWSMFGRDLRVRVSWVQKKGQIIWPNRELRLFELEAPTTPMPGVLSIQRLRKKFCAARFFPPKLARNGLMASTVVDCRWFSCVEKPGKRYSMLKLSKTYRLYRWIGASVNPVVWNLIGNPDETRILQRFVIFVGIGNLRSALFEFWKCTTPVAKHQDLPHNQLLGNYRLKGSQLCNSNLKQGTHFH